MEDGRPFGEAKKGVHFFSGFFAVKFLGVVYDSGFWEFLIGTSYFEGAFLEVENLQGSLNFRN